MLSQMLLAPRFPVQATVDTGSQSTIISRDVLHQVGKHLANQLLALLIQQQYDKHAKESPVKVGDRVMVHVPASDKGKTWKLMRPFHGLYRVISMTPRNAEVQLID